MTDSEKAAQARLLLALKRAKELLDCDNYRQLRGRCDEDHTCPSCLVAADAEAAIAEAEASK